MSKLINQSIISNWANYQEPWPYWNLPVQQARRNLAVILAAQQQDASDTLPPQPPVIVLATGLVLGKKVPEGQLIQAVAAPWFAIVDLLATNPGATRDFGWREWEELIAGAYKAQKWDEVILTPRSGDRGTDIIARRDDITAILVHDQVKAYSPGTVVTLEHVNAMLGVLNKRQEVSKAVITTTSTFAPGVRTDPALQRFIPTRLALRERDELLSWLADIANKARGTS